MNNLEMMKEVDAFIDEQSFDDTKLNEIVLKLREHLGYKECAFYAFRHNRMKEFGYLTQELETKIKREY